MPLFIILVTGALWVACVWVFDQHAIRSSAKQTELRAKSLAEAARAAIERGDVTGARRLIADAVTQGDYVKSRLMLPSGEVLADSTPSLISIRTLPATWSETGRHFDVVQVPGLSVTPIEIAGRGWLQLELLAAPSLSGTDLRPLHIAFALGALALIAGHAVMVRRSAQKFRVAEEVRGALLALDRGETDLSILHITETLGAEVRAWNSLLQARQSATRADAAARPEPVSGASRTGGQLFAACDALPNGLLVVDARQAIRYANGAAVMMLRLGNAEVTGRAFSQLVSDQRVKVAVQEAIASGRRRSTIEFDRTEDGNTSAFSLNIRPLRRDDGGGAVITIEDVTQARTAERARDTFIAQAAHELRTPLTNVRLYVEAAIDAGDDAALRSSSLNIINTECRRLERIVSDMLSVSEIQAGSFHVEMGDVRLDALFEHVCRDFEAQAADKQIKLAFHLPPKLPVARGDRDKIEIAIQNLVGNAIKYTPSGGRVDVSVEATELSLSIAVKDTGIGIAPEAVQKLFGRFYRADDPRVQEITGTGLGLALARDVVRLHGGDITVESELNKGSTFTLTLPLSAEVPQPC